MANNEPRPDLPSHVSGATKGEELVTRHGREPGRQEQAPQRTARDSTSLNPKMMGPIDPRMPHLPPA